MISDELPRANVVITTSIPYDIWIESKKEKLKWHQLIKDGFYFQKNGGDMAIKIKILEGKLEVMEKMLKEKRKIYPTSTMGY